jgi:DNA invertase Pin-like site-specific DNA recombinase
MKVTGATADRPQLKKLMAALGHGDVVIIPAVNHLSRDTLAVRFWASVETRAYP